MTGSHRLVALAAIQALLAGGGFVASGSGDDDPVVMRRTGRIPFSDDDDLPLPRPEPRPYTPRPDDLERIAAAEAKRARKNAKRLRDLAADTGGKPDAAV